MSADRPIAVVSTTISRTVDQFYREITETFQREGYVVHVVTSDGPEIPALRARADQVHIVPMARHVSVVSDVKALLGWVRVLRRVRPQVVFAGTPKASLLGMVASKVTGVPRRAYFLQGLRLEGVEGRQRLVLSAMERLTSACSQVVIAVSPSLAERYRLLRLDRGRPIVVPHYGSSHGVNTEHFTPIPRADHVLAAAGLDPAVPVLAFIGRLTRDKGPDALIDAARRLRQHGTAVQLLILGAQDEADSAAYLQRLRDSGLPVAVYNHLDDVRPFLSVTDILVLPTWREGMPNVVLEAAAMGVPAVTTNATGAVDSVEDGVTGLVVPVDDAVALSSAVERLLSDPALRHTMGSAARARVVADFQPADVAEAVVASALGVASLRTTGGATTIRGASS
ncbi:MAG: glycosyltransferase family 4 protein [Mycobacteriaceae bacterium]